MAISVVLKPFTAYGEKFVPGDLVDTGPFRNESALVGSRYVRPATPEEYVEAMGLTSSFTQDAPRTAATSEDVDPDDPVEDESDEEESEDEEELDEEESDSEDDESDEAEDASDEDEEDDEDGDAVDPELESRPEPKPKRAKPEPKPKSKSAGSHKPAAKQSKPAAKSGVGTKKAPVKKTARRR